MDKIHDFRKDSEWEDSGIILVIKYIKESFEKLGFHNLFYEVKSKTPEFYHLGDILVRCNGNSWYGSNIYIDSKMRDKSMYRYKDDICIELFDNNRDKLMSCWQNIRADFMAYSFSNVHKPSRPTELWTIVRGK